MTTTGRSRSSSTNTPGRGLSFLYKLTAGGLRFTSLAKDSVQDLFVTHPSLSAVVIFFSQSP